MKTEIDYLKALDYTLTSIIFEYERRDGLWLSIKADFGDGKQYPERLEESVCSNLSIDKWQYEAIISHLIKLDYIGNNLGPTYEGLMFNKTLGFVKQKTINDGENMRLEIVERSQMDNNRRMRNLTRLLALIGALALCLELLKTYKANPHLFCFH